MFIEDIRRRRSPHLYTLRAKAKKKNENRQVRIKIVCPTKQQKELKSMFCSAFVCLYACMCAVCPMYYISIYVFVKGEREENPSAAFVIRFSRPFTAHVICLPDVPDEKSIAQNVKALK